MTPQLSAKVATAEPRVQERRRLPEQRRAIERACAELTVLFGAACADRQRRYARKTRQLEARVRELARLMRDASAPPERLLVVLKQSLGSVPRSAVQFPQLDEMRSVATRWAVDEYYAVRS